MPGSVVIVFLVVIAISFVIWTKRMAVAQDRVKQWAQQNGYEIVDCQRRTLLRGPFFLTTGKPQEVYEVTVRDGEGKQREGYLRVGGYVLGMWSDNLEVRWKDEG